MKVKRESEFAQSCLTLHDPMDCHLPGSSIHGIFQARVLEWGAIAYPQKEGVPQSQGHAFNLGRTQMEVTIRGASLTSLLEFQKDEGLCLKGHGLGSVQCPGNC